MDSSAALSYTGVSLEAIFFSKLNLSVRLLKDNFVFCSSYRILKQIRGVLGLKDPSIFSPTCQNPGFKPALLDRVFICWACPLQQIFMSIITLHHLSNYKPD